MSGSAAQRRKSLECPGQVFANMTRALCRFLLPFWAQACIWQLETIKAQHLGLRADVDHGETALLGQCVGATACYFTETKFAAYCRPAAGSLLPPATDALRGCPHHMLVHRKPQCPGRRSPGDPHPGTRAWCDRDVQAPRVDDGGGHRWSSPPLWRRTGEGDIHPPGSGGRPAVAQTQVRVTIHARRLFGTMPRRLFGTMPEPRTTTTQTVRDCQTSI